MRIVHLLRTCIPGTLLLLPVAAAAQRLTAEDYIARWQDVAVAKMKEHGIPASITLAQGLLESGNGNSVLALKANNHFGIKCTPDWSGGKVYHDDDRRNDCFRKYRDAADSYEDHSRFLLRPRYADLFTLKPTDYKGWAHGLKKAGYATDPRYPQKLIDLIERYELHKLDSGQRPARATKAEPPAPARNTSRRRGGEADEVTLNVGGARPVERHAGRIKYVTARQGDTFTGLAEELGQIPGLLARWNDQDKGSALQEGQVVFLQPKRNSVKDPATHTVKAGESLWSISQRHAIKLAKLAAYNGLAPDAPVRPGTVLSLRKPRR
ncbi:MAG: glucosaminidase domain-containing protein [Flavobacteriales bacterium]|nr:glucosaminidase domain-containing protein [Flavobacteriales bacterium]NUQ16342.1 glucosaminidase domain-containing protein [Flavobacteriales bacterium]